MININRLMDNLKKIAGIGRVEGAGITRIAFSDEYYQALNELKTLAESSGYTTRVDIVGNLFIEYNPSGSDSWIMMGSHLDTVNNGGLYDGALGVFTALEVLDTIAESGTRLKSGIRVVAFNAEEGVAVDATFGSGTICGKNDFTDHEFLKDISKFSLSIEEIEDAAMDLSNVLAFLELHIEQGGILDSEAIDIGIVNGIVEIFRYDLILKGTANHGGTTPMTMRDDPVKQLSSILEILYSTAEEYAHPFVMTIGDIQIQPGNYNIVPSELKVKIETRDLHLENLESYFATVQEKLDNLQIEYSLIRSLQLPGAKLDENIINILEDVVKDTDYSYKVMSSGAGHDAAHMSTVAPTGMIFVPSVGGISHSPKEYTSPEQIKKGTEVLLKTVLKIDEELA